MSQGGATDEHRSWAVRGEPREVALREPAAGIPAAVSVNVAGRSICIFDVRRAVKSKWTEQLLSRIHHTAKAALFSGHFQSSALMCMPGAEQSAEQCPVV